jgi:hypothetical protein
MSSCMAACEDKKMIERDFPSELNAETPSLAPLTVSQSSTHWHVCLLKIRHGTFSEVLKQPLIWCHDVP